MVVLFAICKPIAAGVDITGVGNLAPKCGDKIKALCTHTEHGKLQKVEVAARDCRATCTYQPPGDSTVFQGGVWVPNRKYEKVNLPPRMPCAFGATCDEHGNCICDFCSKV
uniref:Putative salp15 n=1 Tax=Ixodes ricinus TaxID=34613 RepID=A0A0K8RD68_IXORI